MNVVARIKHFTRRNSEFGTPRSSMGTIALILVATIISLCYGFSLTNNLVSPLILLAVPLGLVFTWLAYVNTGYAAVVLLAIRWGYITDSIEAVYKIDSPIPALVGLLLLSLIIHSINNRSIRIVTDPLLWWVLAYFLFVCLGLWYANYQERVEAQIIDTAREFIVCFALINLIVSKRLFLQAIWLMLLVGAVLGALTVFQEITQTHNLNYLGFARVKIGHIAEGLSDRPRAGGPTGEPLAFGQQLTVLVPLGLWAVMQARSWFARSAGALATVACIAGVALSFSRSTYIALAVVLVLFSLHVRLNLRYLVFLPLLIVLLQFAPPEFQARVGTLSSLVEDAEDGQGVQSDGSFQNRSVEMLMAVYMFLDHPVIGVGSGNFVEHYTTYIREYGGSLKDEMRNAHSYYLEVAAEHGLVGLLLFGGIMYMTLARLQFARGLFKHTGDRQLAELAVALQIGFLGYMVSALFYHGSYPRYFWVQVTLAVIITAIAKQSLPEQSAAPATVSNAPALDKATA